VKLPSGKVLVIGGFTSGTSPTDTTGAVTNSCEIFDPTGNTWTKTGSMTFTRYAHVAVVLPNGRVLVVGGKGCNPTQSTTAVALSAAEIYDPATGIWTPAGSTFFTHDSCFAAYLSSSNDVVVGGGSVSKRIERYDCADGKWKLSPASLPVLKTNPKALVMASDVLLIVSPGDGLNTLYVANANRFDGGSANGMFPITVVDANNFTVSTPSYSWCSFDATTAVITPVGAPASTIPGPFIYDEHEGVAVTSKKSTTTIELDANQRYAFVDVVDATQFPDSPGWIVFNFGFANQVGPVRYLGQLSGTRLSLDYSFQFPYTTLVGSTVTLLSQKGPWVPDHPETVGSFYLTASSAGRAAAEAAILAAVGAGIQVNVDITYPGDRGLAGEGLPESGNYKLSDKVEIWAGDDVDAEVATAKES
jgi:hypothetical protein